MCVNNLANWIDSESRWKIYECLLIVQFWKRFCWFEFFLKKKLWEKNPLCPRRYWAPPALFMTVLPEICRSDHSWHWRWSALLPGVPDLSPSGASLVDGVYRYVDAAKIPSSFKGGKGKKKEERKPAIGSPGASSVASRAPTAVWHRPLVATGRHALSGPGDGQQDPAALAPIRTRSGRVPRKGSTPTIPACSPWDQTF